MPVIILTQSHVFAALAHGDFYNILDSEWKGFAVLLCNYLYEKNNEQIFFKKPATSLRVPQGDDGDHTTI